MANPRPRLRRRYPYLKTTLQLNRVRAFSSDPDKAHFLNSNALDDLRHKLPTDNSSEAIQSYLAQVDSEVASIKANLKLDSIPNYPDLKGKRVERRYLLADPPAIQNKLITATVYVCVCVCVS